MNNHFINFWKSCTNVRYFSRNTILKEIEKSPKENVDIHGSGRVHQKISNFDKKVLVWMKKYKTIEDVPNSVPLEILTRAKSRFRIRMSNYMMLATVVGCICYAASGKRAAERGETVTKMNEDWHRAYREEAAKNQKPTA